MLNIRLHEIYLSRYATTGNNEMSKNNLILKEKNLPLKDKKKYLLYFIYLKLKFEASFFSKRK